MAEESPLTPQQRLRGLETSGDPDAQVIVQDYKSSILNRGTQVARAFTRQLRKPSQALAPSFANATKEDADEAELRVAQARAKRQEESRERERRVFEIAEGGERREKEMVRLTRASVAAASVSLVVAAAALVVAIVAASCS